jgi:hypothetical protein
MATEPYTMKWYGEQYRAVAMTMIYTELQKKHLVDQAVQKAQEEANHQLDENEIKAEQDRIWNLLKDSATS